MRITDKGEHNFQLGSWADIWRIEVRIRIERNRVSIIQSANRIIAKGLDDNCGTKGLQKSNGEQDG